ncbi:hypothetical protein HHI36_015994 [Cryptolaemus montrouzieri]|uniref:Aldehyde dehydrogenase n=1 Tax=Cryptolaemus montrouzieri TaxID=559131 RepID=A0ABD2N7H2_9CUCU
MAKLPGNFSLPRVEMKNGTGNNAAVIEISDPFLIGSQNSPSLPKTPAEIVKSARAAFRTGKTKPLKYRKNQLEALLRFFEECRLEIEEALYEDLRKHPQEVNIAEVVLVTNDIRHTLIDLKEWMKPKRPSKRLINIMDGIEIYNDPYGVVLIIGAWNYPLLLTLGPLVGALAAGNCVVLKPSEISQATSNLLSKSLTKYLDKETFYVVQGGVQETTMLLEERFDYIFFTGSTTVGKIVHQAAAKHLTPTTLELGGKSPCYLDGTVDMELATRRILWVSAEKILHEFYGDQKFPSDLSKIVSDNHFKRLIRFLENADVAIGGTYLETSRIINPTILINVKESDPVMKEEIFGPILPILTVENCDEAIKYINDNEKPLALYVFSEDKKVQKKFLEETSSGSVNINDTIMQICTENLPFGGVGSSGMGAYHGEEGFKTFSHQKSVLKTMLSPVTEIFLKPRYPPYNERKINLLNMLVKKRRGIPISYISNTLIFVLGFALALGYHKFHSHIQEKHC